MKRKAMGVAVLGLLMVGGCDLLQPKLSVNIKAVVPCNQGNALDGVELLEIEAVGGDGVGQIARGRRSSGKATVAGLNVTDGTTVFMSGFAGSGVPSDGDLPIAAGATAPLNLLSQTTGQKFPAARKYPENGTVYVPMGRVGSFGRTTAGESGECTALSQGRHGHTATFSSAVGRVVIIGGLAYAESDGTETFVPRARALEVYDPNTGRFEIPEVPGNIAPLMEPAFHTATELPDGRILVWGGIGPEGNTGAQVSARAVSFVLDPSNWNVTQLGPATGFSIKRFHHTATLTDNGVSVIMVGGCGCKGQLTDADIKAGRCPAVTDTCNGEQARVAAVDVYDIPGNHITTLATGVLAKPRAFHSAVKIGVSITQGVQRRLVIVGGDDGIAPVREVELLQAEPSVAFVTGLSSAPESLETKAVTHAAAVSIPSDDCTLLDSSHPVGSDCVVLTGGCLALPQDGNCAMVQSTATIIDYGRQPGQRVLDGPVHYRSRWDHAAFFLPRGSAMIMAAGGNFPVDANDVAPGVSVEVVRRQGGAGGVTPFAPSTPPFMEKPARRFATAQFPSGQMMFVGGVKSNATVNDRRSQAEAELFFFPFR